MRTRAWTRGRRALSPNCSRSTPEGKRAQYERTKTHLAIALGEEGFVAAWANGQLLSLGEAITLALADLTLDGHG
jgi:hypothetical protein